MRVEFPKALRVLSHELRGPLGVIQGYLRLLRTERLGAQDEAQTRMLTAMLDATGRITTIARQAADLALWYDGSVPAGTDEISAGTLIDRAVAGASASGISADLADETARFVVRTPNAEALAAAFSALIDAVGRDARPEGVVVTGRLGPDSRLIVAICPASTLPALLAHFRDEDASLGTETADVAFDRGGQGLALVLAASVLETHRAAARSVAEFRAIVVNLPKD